MILLFGNLGNERDVRIKEKEAVVWPKKLLTCSSQTFVVKIWSLRFWKRKKEKIFLNCFSKSNISNSKLNSFLVGNARLDMVMHLFKNGPSLASFLFIFVPIKYKLYRKIVEFSGIRTRIVQVEGEHSDHHHGTYLCNTFTTCTFATIAACIYQWLAV